MAIIIIATVVTIFLVSAVCVQTSSDELIEQNTSESKFQKNCFINPLTQCLATCSICSVSDFDIPAKYITLCQRGISLYLINCKSPARCLKPGWYRATVPITELYIQDTNEITDIESGSFSANPFQNITSLTLRNISIVHLKNGIFRGLGNLQILTISYMPIEIIDPYILDPLVQLRTLHFEENTNVLGIQSLIGKITIPTLENISLRYNNFCLPINNTTFMGLKGLKRISLSDSSIREIGAGTFDHITGTVHFIHLNGNLLRSLPAGLLNKLIQNSTFIDLGDNPWHCDCSLMELKQLIKLYPMKFIHPAVCNSPELYYGLNVENIPDTICGTSREKPNIIEMCANNRISKMMNMNMIESEGQIMAVTGDFDDGVHVHVNFSSDEYVSIWFNNDSCSYIGYESNEMECIGDFNEKRLISNLTNNSTYIFCLLKKYSTLISPFDCIPYHIQSKNDVLSPVIGGDSEIDIMVMVFIILIIIAIFFGLFFGIFLSRRYPAFVRSSASNILIQKISHNEVWKQRESPKKTQGKTVRQVPNLVRSLSDSSIASSQSYITAIEPTAFDKIYWKMNSQKTIETENFYMNHMTLCSSVPGSPPPLPPLPKRNILKV